MSKILVLIKNGTETKIETISIRRHKIIWHCKKSQHSCVAKFQGSL